MGHANIYLETTRAYQPLPRLTQHHLTYHWFLLEVETSDSEQESELKHKHFYDEAILGSELNNIAILGLLYGYHSTFSIKSPRWYTD